MEAPLSGTSTDALVPAAQSARLTGLDGTTVAGDQETMGFTSPYDVEAERRKRALRAEIARLRRRINRSYRELDVETHRLVDWRTYARRYAPLATGAAFAAGLLLASNLKSLLGGRTRGRGVGLFSLAWRMAYPTLVRRAARLAAELLAAPRPEVTGPTIGDESQQAEPSVAFEPPRRRAAGSAG